MENVTKVSCHNCGRVAEYDIKHGLEIKYCMFCGKKLSSCTENTKTQE